MCTLSSEIRGTKSRKTLSEGIENFTSNDAGYRGLSGGLEDNYMCLSSGSMVIGRFGVS